MKFINRLFMTLCAVYVGQVCADFTGPDTKYGTRALDANQIETLNAAFGYRSLYMFNAPDKTYYGANTAAGFKSAEELEKGSYINAVGANSAESVRKSHDGELLIFNDTNDNYYGISYYDINGLTAYGSKSGFDCEAANSVGFGFESLGVCYVSRSVAFGSRAALYGRPDHSGGDGSVSSEVENRTAIGAYSSYAQRGWYLVTAIGYGSLYSGGSESVGIGYKSLYSASDLSSDEQVAIGAESMYMLEDGNENIAIGWQAGSGFRDNGNARNIVIANPGKSADYRVTRIGNALFSKKTYISGIYGANVSNALQLYASTDGQLGVMASSKRFKKSINTIEKASEKIENLRPVSFVYQKDKSHALQYGLIAEEVAKIYPELVQFDADGKPQTVYYHLLMPLLVKKWQQNHIVLQETKVAGENLQATLESQKEILLAYKSSVKELDNQVTITKKDLQTIKNKNAKLREQLQAFNTANQFTSAYKEVARITNVPE